MRKFKNWSTAEILLFQRKKIVQSIYKKSKNTIKRIKSNDPSNGTVLQSSVLLCHCHWFIPFTLVIYSTKRFTILRVTFRRKWNISFSFLRGVQHFSYWYFQIIVATNIIEFYMTVTASFFSLILGYILTNSGI